MEAPCSAKVEDEVNNGVLPVKCFFSIKEAHKTYESHKEPNPEGI